MQPEVRASTESLADWLRAQGARVSEASPAIDWQRHAADYARLLVAQTSVGQPAEQRVAGAAAMRDLGPGAAPYADGLTLDFSALALLLEQRAQLQRLWANFFRDFDVLVMPAFATTAFRHRDEPQTQRTVTIDGTTIPYLQLVFYPQVAIFCGLPSSSTVKSAAARPRTGRRFESSTETSSWTRKTPDLKTVCAPTNKQQLTTNK